MDSVDQPKRVKICSEPEVETDKKIFLKCKALRDNVQRNCLDNLEDILPGGYTYKIYIQVDNNATKFHISKLKTEEGLHIKRGLFVNKNHCQYNKRHCYTGTRIPYSVSVYLDYTLGCNV